MHVSSIRDPVEIIWRDNVLSVARIFHFKYTLHAKEIVFLMDCAIGSEVTVSVMRPIHTCDIIGPQLELCKEIGGLEGLRKIYSMSIEYVSKYCLITERAR